jgi:ACS family hexuronate transporter-like MFS transporter
MGVYSWQIFYRPDLVFLSLLVAIYFSTHFHLDVKKPGLPLVIIYSGTMIGSIGGGYLSSWLIKKGWHVYKARKMALLVSAICVIRFSLQDTLRICG